MIEVMFEYSLPSGRASGVVLPVPHMSPTICHTYYLILCTKHGELDLHLEVCTYMVTLGTCEW